MINLRRRSYQKELLDADDISFVDIAQNLKELNFINTWLGGHEITLNGIKQLANANKQLTICEIGCGGGDNLFTIHKWCTQKKISADFIGIDMNAECIAFAQKQYPQLPCQWICSDYEKVQFKENKPTIIFSSLFCHHFTDEQLVKMTLWLKQNSKEGFFINDLHRHWLAYYLIKWLAKIFSRSYLLKNDAPLSVARGFRKKELQYLFNQSGIKNVIIKWKWAFRWLLIVKNKNQDV
jgi:2-polyprenyl-3-methyl-5-hydroxy-6-metoxy-1,4-benzoquinol methylase